jgi:hypothetical protein
METFLTALKMQAARRMASRVMRSNLVVNLVQLSAILGGIAAFVMLVGGMFGLFFGALGFAFRLVVGF